MTGESARIDVWLWRARFFKSRALAAAAVASGGVRLARAGQSRALDKPSAPVRAGDGLTIARGGNLTTVEIVALGLRRGPAAEARTLYRERWGELDEGNRDSQVSAAPGIDPDAP
jgi:ribosome-associated heat shock protein Hsp15